MVFKNFTRINTLIADVKTLVNIIKRTSKQMGKNKDNSVEHVDLENGIIHGVLKQIKYSNITTANHLKPILTDVWCCDIAPSQSKALITFIREFVSPKELLPLVHVKRFNKVTENKPSQQPESVLKTILCSAELFQDESEILSLLEEHGTSDLNTKSLNFYQKQIPKYPATTKEISQEWTNNYWPMSWKGNPNHQALKAANFNIPQERDMINKLLDKLQQHEVSSSSDFPAVTLIARESKIPKQHEILSISYDNRHNHPLEHSVMKAIEDIAINERTRRCDLENTPYHIHKNDLNYLCHNLLVYTTHEPCVMCSMALVHSRIGRIIYMKGQPETGALAGNYQLGDRDGLNWKFDIWKWMGDEELNRLDSILSSANNKCEKQTTINI